MHHRAPRWSTAAVLLALLLPAASWGQSAEPLPIEMETRSSASGEWVTLGINAVLGGLTAGLMQELRGGSFSEAFIGGTVGGGVAYAGKRVGVERWMGAGLLGREIHAVGASMVANSADGRPILSRVVLPLGPMRMYIDPSLDRMVHLRLDFASSLALLYTVTQPEMHLDVHASISAGAPVFYTRDRDRGQDPWGMHAAGVVWIEVDESEWRGSGKRISTILAHERVHVLQHDYAMQVWSVPTQAALSRRVPGGEWLSRHLDLGLHVPLWGIANVAIPYRVRPWEQEAYFLSNRPAGRAPDPVDRPVLH